MAKKTKSVKSEPILDLSGVWSEPGNPGFGFFINNFQGGVLQSIAVYSHDSEGGQVWLIGTASGGANSFDLFRPSGTGFLGSIEGFSNGPAVGTIEFTYEDVGVLNYTARIKTPVVQPIDFSPSPEFSEFTGTVTRLS